jgi:hypothetical protein
MFLRRLLGSTVSLVAACLPVAVVWLLILMAIKHQAGASPPGASPNPSDQAVPLLGLVEVLVYADPMMAGSISVWMVPATFLILAMAFWAAGVPVFTKQAPAGWPPPSLALVTMASLAAGVFAATPWLYAWGLLLRASP